MSTSTRSTKNDAEIHEAVRAAVTGGGVCAIDDVAVNAVSNVSSETPGNEERGPGA